MRFVWAVVAFVLAAGLVAMGVAQRTILLGPDSETFTVSSEEDTPFTVIDSDVFEALPEALPGESGTLTISSDGPIFATYARTTDVMGWLSDQRFTHATADGGAIETTTVEPTADIKGDPKPRNPEGSDLWLEEFTADGSMEQNFSFPEGMELSVLIASDGEAPAPATIEVTWPIDNSTPAAPWFIGFGIGALVVGIVLYILAVIHSRRSRGPRRKGTPVPLTGAIAVARDKHAASPSLSDELEGEEPTGAALPAGRGVDDAAPGEQDRPVDDTNDDGPNDDDMNDDGPDDGAGAGDEPAADAPSGGESASAAPDAADDGTAKRTARRASRWLRMRTAVPALGLSVALLAGCTPDAPAASPEPSPSATDAADEDETAQQPAITETQAERIVADVSAVVAKADKKNDADIAAKRLTGTALRMREINYDLRKEVDKHDALPSIPAEPLALVLPQAFDGWPRSVLVVVEDAKDSTVAPTMLTLTQKNPWAKYKASYVAQLRPSAEVPELAPDYQGAALVPPDSSFLQLAPQEVPDAYASILRDGKKSDSAALFDLEGDGFYAEVSKKRKETLKNFNKTGKETGELTFGQSGGTSEPFALMTLQSGAIVGVSVIESETVKPTEEDAVIRFEDDKVLQALTGEENSAGGVKTRYLDQLFFYVPAQGSEEPIRLLASSSSILDAEILEAENPESDNAESEDSEAGE